MSHNAPNHRRRPGRSGPGESAKIESLILEAKNEADIAKRHVLFMEAIQLARESQARGLELEALALAVIFNIGGGYSRKLLRLFWPFFGELEGAASVLDGHIKRHWFLWAAEKVLYFAADYPSVPLSELHGATASLIAATKAAGGYEPKASLRLQLHQSLRLGWIEKAHPLMRELEKQEALETLRPHPGLFPKEHDSGGVGTPRDFGCNAYANQVQVTYHCANNDARSAWRCARYLVEGRSSCALSLCALAPREALAALLEPLLDADMRQKADAAHRLGLPMVIDKPEAAGWLGHHLRYMVRTGAESQACAILEPLLAAKADSRITQSATPFHRFHFLRGALAVLRVSNGSSVDSKLLASEAAALAQEFDNRSGGDVFARMLENDSKP